MRVHLVSTVWLLVARKLESTPLCTEDSATFWNTQEHWRLLCCFFPGFLGCQSPKVLYGCWFYVKQEATERWTASGTMIPLPLSWRTELTDTGLQTISEMWSHVSLRDYSEKSNQEFSEKSSRTNKSFTNFSQPPLPSCNIKWHESQK